MILATRQIASLALALLVTLAGAASLTPGCSAGEIQPVFCDCGLTPVTVIVDRFYLPPEPMLLHPRLAKHAKIAVPYLICEKAGDPLTVVPCDQPDLP